MAGVPHKVELKLNSPGFKGADVDALLPHFMDRRTSLVGLTWYPNAEGPERFVLVVTIVSAVGVIANAFLHELSKDLYTWIKSKVQPLFRSKAAPYGFMRIKFKDVEIDFWTDGGDEWLAVLECIPSIVKSIDPDRGSELVVEREGGEFVVRLYPKKQ